MAVLEAVSTMLGWTVVIVLTLIVGFCAGYWTGHHQITSIGQTVSAFVWIPILWLAFAQMFAAYAVTALAWYLPIYFERLWLKVCAVIATFSTWFLVIWSIVAQSDVTKGLHY
jgi:hypothetical protein